MCGKTQYILVSPQTPYTWRDSRWREPVTNSWTCSNATERGEKWSWQRMEQTTFTKIMTQKS